MGSLKEAAGRPDRKNTTGFMAIQDCARSVGAREPKERPPAFPGVFPAGGLSFSYRLIRPAGCKSWKSLSISATELANSLISRQLRQIPVLVGPLADSIIQ